MDLPDIDFSRMRSGRAGGQREGFEDFVCELAAEDPPHPEATFVRLHGAGGDGGVECFWSLPDGTEDGWQAKFWLGQGDVDKAQLDASVETALKVHPRLWRYTIAIPVDPTGPTARAGKSLYEKVYESGGWLDGWKKAADARGMTVEFRLCWGGDLITRLRQIDTNGIRTRYWFDADLLTEAWWQDRLRDGVEASRPRYIPELSVMVPAAASIAAQCGDPGWRAAVETRIAGLRDDLAGISRAEGHGRDLAAVSSAVDRVVAALETWRETPAAGTRSDLDSALEDARAVTSDAEHAETETMDREHGDNWDTRSWRQFKAEYEVSFPAARVDALRDLMTRLDDVTEFLAGPLERLPGTRCALLTGAAGTGKTFVTCDVVSRRLAEGHPSLFVHGRWFTTGDVLIQLRDHLQLPTDLTGEEILTLLDQAGRVAGSPVLLVIDALNETRPRTVWRDHLDRVAAMIGRYDHLRVLFTVRSHYRPQVIPDELDLPVVVHRGFEGAEFEAVMEYADYYGLEPPTAPPVHGEFDNPLFLRLLCEALKSEGRLSLDQASMGISELARLLLRAVNNRISDQLGVPRNDRVVNRAITRFVTAIATNPVPWLDRETAVQLVGAVWPDRTAEGSLLEALISEGLLAEDVGPPDTADSGTVAVAFERLGQHLVIIEALDRLTSVQDVEEALRDGELRQLLGLDADPDRGLLEALSVAVAERLGIELTAFTQAFADIPADVVLGALIAGLPWRAPASITDQTRAGVLQALGSEAVFSEALDMLFRLAVRPDHPLNADFLHELLSPHTMAERDSYLVAWLHQTHGSRGGVDRLISWGRHKDIRTVSRDTCRLWVTALLWCTGCSDRRVRDGATIAAARLLARHPGQAPAVLALFLGAGDDWITERACYTAYAALLHSGQADDWRAAADVAWQAVFAGTPPLNAAIRDEARSILEAAAARTTLPPDVDTSRVLPPYDSPWPIHWPEAHEIAAYDGPDYPRLVFSCTGDDFFTYQIGWAFRDLPGIEPEAAGRRIVQDVIGLGYEPALHAGFDQYVVSTFGRGRGKPKWIERIGKKYQWIALARLVGHVGDHLTRTPEPWEPPLGPVPGPQCDRLRQLDPTVFEPPADPDPARSRVPPYDWAQAADTTDEDWIANDSDLPDLAVDNIGDTRTQFLITGSYQREAPGQTSGDRRVIWANIAALLVKPGDMPTLHAELSGRDLAGHDLFRVPQLTSGFIGEYPYGHHYAAELREVDQDDRQLFSVPTAPATYDLLGEYEYAPDDLDGISLAAPAPVMFGSAPGTLRWDGQSSWASSDGLIIASAPHVPGSRKELTIDRTWLTDWLQANALDVIWVEAIGKDVHTGRRDGSYTPGRLMRTRVRYRDPAGHITHLEPGYFRLGARDGGSRRR